MLCCMVIVSTHFSKKDETCYVRIDQTHHLMLFTYAESESVTRQIIFLLHNPPPSAKTKRLPNYKILQNAVSIKVVSKIVYFEIMIMVSKHMYFQVST